MADFSQHSSVSEINENEKKKCKKGNFMHEEEQTLFQAYSKVKEKNGRTMHMISIAVNQVGVSPRTEQECPVKWGNLHRNAKASDSKYRKSLVRTGGRSPTMPPSGVIGDVASLCAKQASFSWISGALETNVTGTSLSMTSQPGCTEVIHPTNVNVEFIRQEIETLADKDLLSDSKRQPKKRYTYSIQSLPTVSKYNTIIKSSVVCIQVCAQC